MQVTKHFTLTQRTTKHAHPPLFTHSITKYWQIYLSQMDLNFGNEIHLFNFVFIGSNIY